MYLNSVNLRIARDNVRAHIPAALDLAQGGKVRPREVVSHVLDWETLPEELPRLHMKPVFVRDPVAAPSASEASEASA
jgi:alcohol dehydrogenase